jgi:hypothetical protein
VATKEDILEQIVEEYLSHKGYFVRHNIKFVQTKVTQISSPATTQIIVT